MGQITELGYIGFEVTDLAAWERFAVGLLGLAPGEAVPGERLSLRMDERVHRIVLEQGPADDLAFIGFDCGTSGSLDQLVALLREHGHDVAPGDSALATRRGVERIALTQDPAGNRVELYVGLARSATPFVSTLVPGGFLTGRGGAGHAFLPVADRAAMLAFYQALGFRISDYIRQEVAPGMVVDAVFTHCNPRHHTLAFAELPAPKHIHHFMIEVPDALDVGRAHDRVQDAHVPLALSLGAHPNDRMFSFYAVTPSGFCIEFGAGGRAIEDDANWEVVTYDRLSSWGHRPPATPAKAGA